MPKTCACCGCTHRSNRDENVSFHKFPLDDTNLLKKWLTNISRDKFVPTANHCVCSDHFLSNDYLRESKPLFLMTCTEQVCCSVQPVQQKFTSVGILPLSSAMKLVPDDMTRTLVKMLRRPLAPQGNLCIIYFDLHCASFACVSSLH